MRGVVFTLVAAGAFAPPLAAQVSVYGVHGLGFPGRSVSVRARALGGGIGVFDPASAINPAAPAGFPRVSATAAFGTQYRSYEVGGVAGTGLRSTRFPLALVGGPIAGGLAFAVSFGTYADRTFDLVSSDTLLLRGQPVAVNDRVFSDGGVTDIRGALAWALSDRFSIGVSGHLLSGSSKLEVRRVFADSAYRSFRQEGETSFSGQGVSAGLIWRVVPGVRIAAAGRLDGSLDTELDSVPQGRFHLPMTAVGGVELAPLPPVRIAATVQWRSWSDAADDVAPAGASAFDTWEVGAGLELGGVATGTSRVPLRLGFRYAQIPFAPDAQRPREISLSVGTGLLFAASRGLLDLAIERVLRDGTGVRERAWQISVGITVRP